MCSGPEWAGVVLTGVRQCRDDSFRIGFLVDNTGVYRHISGQLFQLPIHVRGVDEWQYIGVRKRNMNALPITCIAARLCFLCRRILLRGRSRGFA